MNIYVEFHPARGAGISPNQQNRRKKKTTQKQHITYNNVKMSRNEYDDFTLFVDDSLAFIMPVTS